MEPCTWIACCYVRCWSDISSTYICSIPTCQQIVKGTEIYTYENRLVAAWKTGQMCSLHYQHSTFVCFLQLYIEIGGFHDRAGRDDNWRTHVLCNALALRLTFETKRHGDKYRKSVSEWAPNGPTWCVCTERVLQIQVGYRNIRCFPSDFQFQSTKLNKQNEIPTSTTDRSAGQYRASEVTRRDEMPKRESRALSLSAWDLFGVVVVDVSYFNVVPLESLVEQTARSQTRANLKDSFI